MALDETLALDEIFQAKEVVKMFMCCSSNFNNSIYASLWLKEFLVLSI